MSNEKSTEKAKKLFADLPLNAAIDLYVLIGKYLSERVDGVKQEADEQMKKLKGEQ